MRFIHLADVHLGAVPDRGCPWSSRREEDIWETFRRVIAGIRENPVDLLFIAGDLFHRQPLLRELKEVNNLFSTIPDTRVYLMAGNHDYIKADSFYRDFQWEKNVTFFKNEQLTCVKDEKLDVYVYGLSYEHQEIENPLYDSIHPAEGEGVHILLAHGGDAKHIPMNIKSIAASGFDYIALGHIHKPQILIRDNVAYAGALEPVDRNDLGDHGYIEGHLENGSPMGVMAVSAPRENRPMPRITITAPIRKASSVSVGMGATVKLRISTITVMGTTEAKAPRWP